MRFADPRSEVEVEPYTVRNDHTKEEVIQFAMDALQWKEAKCLSWYKLQIPQLGGNSPKELVQRGQTSRVIEYLLQKKREREKTNFGTKNTR